MLGGLPKVNKKKEVSLDKPGDSVKPALGHPFKSLSEVNKKKEVSLNKPGDSVKSALGNPFKRDSKN